MSYIPKDEGEHDIHLKYNGQVLPDSPFPVVAMEGFDPTRVQAFGDGLDQGFVDEPNEFTIDTKNAGAGGLGLAIEGPSEATMTCNDNKDGTATVEYVPTEEGDYDVAIRFGDEHIPGSPFKVWLHQNFAETYLVCTQMHVSSISRYPLLVVTVAALGVRAEAILMQERYLHMVQD